MNKKSFHLRWNNHLQNLQSLFENLYNEQSLVDVTLSCSDGLLHSHKLVLSACSPYFEKIFTDIPCKHPVIILKGIKVHEMHCLLKYMYVGSVDIEEEDLEMVLDTAAELQIKGLVQQRTGETFSHQSTKSELQFSSRNSPADHNNPDDLRWQAELVAKPSLSNHGERNSYSSQANSARHSQASEEEDLSNSNRHLEPQVEMEYDSTSQQEADQNEQSMNELGLVKEEYQSEEETIREYAPVDIFSSKKNEKSQPFSNTRLENDESPFCQICNRGFLNKGSYQRHMLTHTGVKPHSCTFCNQSFLRMSHLQRHIRVHTGERPYQCGECPKQFARSDKLRQHYIIQHNGNDSKVPKTRGRPRKNLDMYGPLSSSFSPTSLMPLNNEYSVSINPVSTDAV